MSRLFLLIFNRPDEACFSSGQAVARRSEFGIEQINVPALIAERRLDFQRPGTRNRFKKADFQRGRHGFDAVMKKAMRHGCIEQRTDHPTMQKSGIALPVWISLKNRNNGIPLWDKGNAN